MGLHNTIRFVEDLYYCMSVNSEFAHFKMRFSHRKKINFYRSCLLCQAQSEDFSPVDASTTDDEYEEVYDELILFEKQCITAIMRTYSLHH